MSSEMINKLLFFYTESSMHAGTGSSVSAVDLPIQRERATQYPLVQSSGVKGALRSQANLSKHDLIAVFGPDPDDLKKDDNKNGHAGAISVGDARIVLFPVRSLSGVFAYATSALALARLARLRDEFPIIPDEPEITSALVTASSNLSDTRGRVVLEEFTFNAQPSTELTTIADWLADNALPQSEDYAYWREKIRRSLILLPENDFRDFVVSSTEITTRVKLETATKTVTEGALWTQESIPSDGLFVVPIVARAARNGAKLNAQAVADLLITPGTFGGRIQLGGDETTGQGFVALQWA